ncbi:iron chelate uptake ABC transporter family permease subunit, partial [Rhizobium sp. TRM95111]|uniref:iron chelate uptake ABC transporter family permease subunit n=1 Tax=Rhizobium alarense TaxID=2846851 RepID=UPI001F358875
MTAFDSESRHSADRWWKLAVLVAVPAAVAAVLTFHGGAALIAPDLWWRALVHTDNSVASELLFRHAYAPRVAVSILAGLGLGLSGVLLQHILRNPLAEPTTVGTNAGAGLALTVATLYAPHLLESGRSAVAMAGGAASMLLVFLLASRLRFSPVAVIVSGLVTSLTCGSAGALLMAINREYTEDLFIWQSGSLVQNGDAVAKALLPQLLACGLLAFLFLRPLRLLDAGDEAARSLGLRPAIVRLAGLAIAVAASTFVVSAAGVISFVALAAPAFAR